MLAVLIHI